MKSVAILLGTAEILSKWTEKIHGSIKFCFQPGEEGGAGAKAMIEDKNYPLLNNPEVDQCYGLHISSPSELGKILAMSGGISANTDSFQIKISVLKYNFPLLFSFNFSFKTNKNSK